MEIQYVIINFLILVLILVVAGRKTVKRIFGDKRKRILSELDEADKIETLVEKNNMIKGIMFDNSMFDVLFDY